MKEAVAPESIIRKERIAFSPEPNVHVTTMWSCEFTRSLSFFLVTDCVAPRSRPRFIPELPLFLATPLLLLEAGYGPLLRLVMGEGLFSGDTMLQSGQLRHSTYRGLVPDVVLFLPWTVAVGTHQVPLGQSQQVDLGWGRVERRKSVQTAGEALFQLRTGYKAYEPSFPVGELASRCQG